MNYGQEVLLSCSLSRSAFSGERVYRVTLPTGEEHIGVVPLRACLTKKKEPLAANLPDKGKKIEGYITVLLLGKDDQFAQVLLPTNETESVESTKLTTISQQRTSYVPIG